jgi:hypothetical protein
MATIKVASPFMLQLPPPDDAPPQMGPSEKLFFPEPGEYEVDQPVADHWYTQMHLDGYVPPPTSITPEVRVMLTVEQAKAKQEQVPATTS